MTGRVHIMHEPPRWRVFLESAPDDFVCVGNFDTEAEAEVIRGSVESIVCALVAEGAQKAANEAAGRAIAAPSLMDAIDAIGDVDTEAIAVEMLRGGA